MVEEEFKALLDKVGRQPCELKTLEIKAAHKGCPSRLYDTFSAFANQNEGGILLFGLDEGQAFAKVGVYDVNDLQRKLQEIGEEMYPVVRPILSVYTENGLHFVTAEIPPLDLSERPCFKRALGRIRGSFVRVGDADKPMTDYEVYSYEAYRKQIKDDLRPVEGLCETLLDSKALETYLQIRTKDRPNLNEVSREHLYELTFIKRNGQCTLTALLLFGFHPQSLFPQLSIVATRLPGNEAGELNDAGARFLDSARMEGGLSEMLEGALAFVKRNMRMEVRINPHSGQREDVPEYPLDAVREAILNALVHRDYSRYTESKPIQLIMFQDRMEIRNPGGIYGRIGIDQLGMVQPDTRNPELILAMESLGQTENRYSGIPRIRRAMADAGLPEPEFSSDRGEFVVCLKTRSLAIRDLSVSIPLVVARKAGEDLCGFCSIPRTRREIAAFLGIKSISYAMSRYVTPLLEEGKLRLCYPERPRSSKQRYVFSEKDGAFPASSD